MVVSVDLHGQTFAAAGTAPGSAASAAWGRLDSGWLGTLGEDPSRLSSLRGVTCGLAEPSRSWYGEWVPPEAGEASPASRMRSRSRSKENEASLVDEPRTSWAGPSLAPAVRPYHSYSLSSRLDEISEAADPPEIRITGTWEFTVITLALLLTAKAESLITTRDPALVGRAAAWQRVLAPRPALVAPSVELRLITCEWLDSNASWSCKASGLGNQGSL